jgi:hypothetical protein
MVNLPNELTMSVLKGIDLGISILTRSESHSWLHRILSSEGFPTRCNDKKKTKLSDSPVKEDGNSTIMNWYGKWPHFHVNLRYHCFARKISPKSFSAAASCAISESQ